jgi:hypothetical protein
MSMSYSYSIVSISFAKSAWAIKRTPTILFTTSILPKAALHAYFRNSSAIRFEAKNHDGPVRAIHIPVRAVTKREQWQDPDTSSSVSS